MQSSDNMQEFHWLVDMVESVDVGLVILNRTYQVLAWNGFMENHSGISAGQAKDRKLFDLVDGLPQQWLERKIDIVSTLKTRAYTSWEQRPWVFRFPNPRPVTGLSDFMYQNMTITPLKDTSGEVQKICLMIYDVTELATTKLALKDANQKLDNLSGAGR